MVERNFGALARRGKLNRGIGRALGSLARQRGATGHDSGPPNDAWFLHQSRERHSGAQGGENQPGEGQVLMQVCRN